jgi:hypothetical protein
VITNLLLAGIVLALWRIGSILNERLLHIAEDIDPDEDPPPTPPKERNA